MKTTKLTVGIIQMILAAFILLQSCAVGTSHAFENKTSDAGGTAGLFVAILFLATGIVYVASRKSQKLGGDIAGLIMMLIAWIMGITNAHDYGDLQIWGWLAFIIGVGFFVWHLIANKKAKNNNAK
ncbi:hypothetical protein [Lactobacillus sp. ESL0677]|uniref:hypothetical protein n=1 Tax=Lactobacillus sp. ESL0677 TaxID=2983208 RepID=UPI0023F7115F|nr:hypothetical protein [Lactobacillus sp. ESL0677]WEV36262.1 hypothetical protein OZX76_05810 [Lactobacillus sp. ESL0677]